MKQFRLVAADSVAKASSLHEGAPAETRFVAGGTDLLSEIKEGVVHPTTLVSLTGLEDLEGVTVGPHGLRIGALTTITSLAAVKELASSYPALAQAAASIATPQVRNVATVGGNLCQRPRCWYYRSPQFDCRKKGGTVCFAAENGNRFHAILGGVDCHIVHPSDLAVALTSLRASAGITHAGGSRGLPLEQFFAGPERDITTETVLGPGEILTHVLVPQTSPSHRSTFLKARERQSQDFALASVAVAFELTDGIVRDPRITLGGVAPVPLRVPGAEAALEGRSTEDVDTRSIGEIAVRGAKPLKENHFKVLLTASLVSRAVASLIGES